MSERVRSILCLVFLVLKEGIDEVLKVKVSEDVGVSVVNVVVVGIVGAVVHECRDSGEESFHDGGYA